MANPRIWRFITDHSIAVITSVIAAGVVAIIVYVYNTSVSPEADPSGTIARSDDGDQVAAKVDVIVNLQDLKPDDQV